MLANFRFYHHLDSRGSVEGGKVHLPPVDRLTSIVEILIVLMADLDIGKHQYQAIFER